MDLDINVCMQDVLQSAPIGGMGPDLDGDIIALVAGTESDKPTGLAYYFLQQELQQLLETERLTELALMSQLQALQ